MNIDVLTRLANDQSKGTDRDYRKGYDVAVSRIIHGSKTRVSIAVYSEPCKCHFGDTDYWQAIFVKSEERLYLIYSDKKHGYKKQRRKTSLGYFQFTNTGLLDYMKDHYTEETIYRKWKWDSECARPYIDLK